jgi:hypothetical protein
VVKSNEKTLFTLFPDMILDEFLIKTNQSQPFKKDQIQIIYYQTIKKRVFILNLIKSLLDFKIITHTFASELIKTFF